MRRFGVSRFGGLAGLVVSLGAVVLAGCATGRTAEVKQLQARAAYERGVKDLEEGRTALGLAALQEAVTLDPDTALYHHWLGLAYLNLKNPQFLPKAVEALKRALELNPNNGDTQTSLGVAYAEQGKWAEAVQQYRKALDLPGYGNVEMTYHNLGWAYYNLNRLSEAEESFRLILKLDPKAPSAHYMLGVVLLKAGRRDEAKVEFRWARELAPETPFGLAAQQHLKALGEGG